MARHHAQLHGDASFVLRVHWFNGSDQPKLLGGLSLKTCQPGVHTKGHHSVMICRLENAQRKTHRYHRRKVESLSPLCEHLGHLQEDVDRRNLVMKQGADQSMIHDSREEPGTEAPDEVAQEAEHRAQVTPTSTNSEMSKRLMEL